jgi:uncharacterized protein (DUF305 family)
MFKNKLSYYLMQYVSYVMRIYYGFWSTLFLLSLSAGATSLTVRSTKTPPIMRKHRRSGDTSDNVSMTNLHAKKCFQVYFNHFVNYMLKHHS